jgi:DNA-binding GntR family transcriptional regulator
MTKPLPVLTALESEVLNSFVSGLYAEPGFSDVDVNDIAQSTGISSKSIRGALASLVKKGIVTVNDNGAGYQIIDLNVEYWHLVNKSSWAEAAEWYLGKERQA